MRQHRVIATVCFALVCSGAFSVVDHAAAAEKKVIGFAVPVLANPFWKQEVDFAKRVADELGGELIVEDANQDEAKQLQIMDNFASRKVDAIITAPVTTAVAPALIKAAGRANIPIFFAERTDLELPHVEEFRQTGQYLIIDDRIKRPSEQLKSRLCRSPSIGPRPGCKACWPTRNIFATGLLRPPLGLRKPPQRRCTGARTPFKASILVFKNAHAPYNRSLMRPTEGRAASGPRTTVALRPARRDALGD